MSDVTKQAVNLVIDAAEKVGNTALVTLGGTVDLAAAAVTAPIRVGDSTADAALAEAKGLLAKAMALLRDVADAVTEPLP